MSVELATNEAGDYALGAKVAGVFVPIATVSAAHVAQRLQRAEDLAEKAADEKHEGHAQALGVIETDWKVLGSSSSGKGSK